MTPRTQRLASFYGSIRRVTRRGGVAIAPFLDGFGAAIALAAIASLVAEYGFWLGPVWIRAAHILTLFALWGFAALTGARLLAAPNIAQHLRVHWIDILLVCGLFAAYVVALPFTGIGPLRDTLAYFVGRDVYTLTLADRLYILLIKGYVLATLLLGSARHGHRLLRTRFRPTGAVLLSFLAAIATGSLLLLLPKATVPGLHTTISDALFTSTSAVCVTGLTVVDTGAHFTWFGQSVILALLQIGGLGYMTLAWFYVLFVSSHGSLRDYAYVRDAFQDVTLIEARNHIRSIVVLTVSIEAIGAMVLYASLPRDPALLGGRPAWFHAVFLAASSFCNAGFSLWGDSLSGRDVAFSAPVNLVIMALIVLGGIGFAVLREATRLASSSGRPTFPRRWSLQSRMAIIISAALILAGMIGYLWLENSTSLRGLPMRHRVLAAAFQSITARTAGFNTLDTAGIAAPTALLLIGLMVIGASPGGTGGGIKTTTLGVSVMSALAAVRGRRAIEMRRRRIPEDTAYQALSVVLFAVAVLSASLFLLTVTDPGVPLLHLMFEEASAFGTVGLSMGATTALSHAGRFVLLLSMFLGRVGPLTIAIALSRRKLGGRVEYPTERVSVM
ncbi:Trk family potassium uptake protein [Candidatus Poribacteria bacterium]|nr:Trk family potassium uptake protein [Candidatus Poribacteria bacterium]MBT7808948.1 Trk family potassium uptake protein [Candidatus Poribacteria bacterium]